MIKELTVCPKLSELSERELENIRRAFDGKVGRYCPDYRERRKKLKFIEI